MPRRGFKLSLTLRAKEGRSSRLGDPLDGCGAAAGAARVPFAPIDIKAVLKISKLSIRLAKILER
jgi:hypothetical protein